jgi:hypothetical protein
MKTIVSVCDVCKKRSEYQEDAYAIDHKDRSVVLWEDRKRMATLDVCQECFRLLLEACQGVLRGEPVALYRCNPDGSRVEVTPALPERERAPEAEPEPEPALPEPEPAESVEAPNFPEREPAEAPNYDPPRHYSPDSSFTGREGRDD